MSMTIRFVIIVIISIIVLGASWFITNQRSSFQKTQLTTTPPIISSTTPSVLKNNASQSFVTIKNIRAQDITGIAKEFAFSAQIPDSWQTEAALASQAIAIYDPGAPGINNLEKSQIFIRYFTASDFLTLPTVTIHERTSLTIADSQAVRYDIEKKRSVENFPNQPQWRNERHIVTDVRVSKKNPSLFYVIAKRPDLSEKVYETFLQSLQIDTVSTSFVEPIAEFNSRITKKPFGISITPNNSPVSPEKFTGYHTGVDVEYGDVKGDVAVHAIAPGTVRVARTASGYGGIIAIEHNINTEPFVALYGHLRPLSMAREGKTVIAGEVIGMLGEGGTTETDFERKHLHFAVRKDATIDLRGYVPDKQELSPWKNPAEMF